MDRCPCQAQDIINFSLIDDDAFVDEELFEHFDGEILVVVGRKLGPPSRQDGLMNMDAFVRQSLARQIELALVQLAQFLSQHRGRVIWP